MAEDVPDDVRARYPGEEFDSDGPAWFGPGVSERSQEFQAATRGGTHTGATAAEADSPQPNEDDGVCPARVKVTRHIRLNSLFAPRIR